MFDDMLDRSIPQLDVMRDVVYQVTCKFRQEGTAIVDLGSSRGGAVARLLDKYGAHNKFVLVEHSRPMLEALHERFDGWAGRGRVVQVLDLDLREEFPPHRPSVVLSVLTLMFVPIERRQRLVQEAYRSLLPRGALIVVEKVLGATAEINEMMVDVYHRKKQKSGYSAEDIERKRLSLQGVLVPVTARWNEELLRMAGFRQVDVFWRWMNFCAWVAVKEPLPSYAGQILK